MALALVGAGAAFTSPSLRLVTSRATARAYGLHMSEQDTVEAPQTVTTAGMTGVVMPTGDVTGDVTASPPPTRNADWNPKGLDVNFLPGFLQEQFVPTYLKTSPQYLDGATLPGDIGFDP